MTAHIREAIQHSGAAAVERLQSIVDDDAAFGASGWLSQREQLRVLELAMDRAYGRAMHAPTNEDEPATNSPQTIVMTALERAVAALDQEKTQTASISADGPRLVTTDRTSEAASGGKP